jgi:hypothetical protein
MCSEPCCINHTLGQRLLTRSSAIATTAEAPEVPGRLSQCFQQATINEVGESQPARSPRATMPIRIRGNAERRPKRSCRHPIKASSLSQPLRRLHIVSNFQMDNLVRCPKIVGTLHPHPCDNGSHRLIIKYYKHPLHFRP